MQTDISSAGSTGKTEKEVEKNNTKNMKERIMFMSVSKKRMMVLIAALVFTIAGTVMVFATEILYTPQYSSTTGRYTQVYEMSTTLNWSFTTNITNCIGKGDPKSLFAVKKVYNNRDGIIQCDLNGVTAFPTYYRAYEGYAYPSAMSYELAFIGTGIEVMDYPQADFSDYNLCLGIRNDPRYTSSASNGGCWSPDTY